MEPDDIQDLTTNEGPRAVINSNNAIVRGLFTQLRTGQSYTADASAARDLTAVVTVGDLIEFVGTLVGDLQSAGIIE